MRTRDVVLILATLAGFTGLAGCQSKQGSKTGKDDAGAMPTDALSADAPAGSDRWTQADHVSATMADGAVTGLDTKAGQADAVVDAPGIARDSATATDTPPGIRADSANDGSRDVRTADQAGDSTTGKDTLVAADILAAAEAGSPVAPTFAVEMTKADQARFYGRASNGGGYGFGIANASAGDNNVAELTFKGNAALGPSDKLTPEFATEIGTNDVTFGFGTYRTRVQLARCASSEELVNGIFTYFNDGKDHDGDGMIDNSEIDIEILCSDPSIISLTIWSEYTSDTAKRNVGRVIHTQTGAYQDTQDDQDMGSGSKPEFKWTGFPDPNAFYEMGFEWHADHIRYFIVINGAELTLWTYTYAKYIPTLPAAFLFNVWHSTDWWSSRGTADYPASDATMRVDWFRYWKE